jgi:hypothetical protein
MPDEYPSGFALFLAEEEAAATLTLTEADEGSLRRGLAQSAAGQIDDLGDFTQDAR